MVGALRSGRVDGPGETSISSTITTTENATDQNDETGKKQLSVSDMNELIKRNIEVQWNDPILVVRGICVENGAVSRAVSSALDNDVIKLEVNTSFESPQTAVKRKNVEQQPSHNDGRSISPVKRRKLSPLRSAISVYDDVDETSISARTSKRKLLTVPAEADSNSRCSSPTKRRKISRQSSPKQSEAMAQEPDDLAEQVSLQVKEEFNESIARELRSSQSAEQSVQTIQQLPSADTQVANQDDSTISEQQIDVGIDNSNKEASIESQIEDKETKRASKNDSKVQSSVSESGESADEDNRREDIESTLDIAEEPEEEPEVNPNPDAIDEKDLPPPFLPKLAEPLSPSDFPDAAALLLNKLYAPIPAYSQFVNALVAHPPSKRSTETLIALALNTQEALKAWQDEYIVIDRRTAPASTQVGRKLATGGRTPMSPKVWEAMKEDEILAKIGLSYSRPGRKISEPRNGEKRELRRRRADASIIGQLGTGGENSGADNERTRRRERRPVRRFEIGINDNAGRGRRGRRRGGRVAALSRRSRGIDDDQASNTGAEEDEPMSGTVTPQISEDRINRDNTTARSSRGTTATPAPQQKRNRQLSKPKSEKRSESMTLWWAARKKAAAEQKMKEMREKGLLEEAAATETSTTASAAATKTTATKRATAASKTKPVSTSGAAATVPLDQVTESDRSKQNEKKFNQDPNNGKTLTDSKAPQTQPPAAPAFVSIAGSNGALAISNAQTSSLPTTTTSVAPETTGAPAVPTGTTLAPISGSLDTYPHSSAPNEASIMTHSRNSSQAYAQHAPLSQGTTSTIPPSTATYSHPYAAQQPLQAQPPQHHIPNHNQHHLQARQVSPFHRPAPSTSEWQRGYQPPQTMHPHMRDATDRPSYGYAQHPGTHGPPAPYMTGAGHMQPHNYYPGSSLPHPPQPPPPPPPPLQASSYHGQHPAQKISPATSPPSHSPTYSQPGGGSFDKWTTRVGVTSTASATGPGMASQGTNKEPPKFANTLNRDMKGAPVTTDIRHQQYQHQAHQAHGSWI